MPQIRLNKTPELEEVLAFLQRKYRLLSEAEIVKIALAEKYNREISDKDLSLHNAWRNIKHEGKQLGEQLIKAKGLSKENLTEEDFYQKVLKND